LLRADEVIEYKSYFAAVHQSACGVRRDKAALSSVGASPTRQPLQPEATGAVGSHQKSVHTESQRQAQAAGHLDLAGSGLHDSSPMRA
jgi:hypothetical protein